MQALAKDVRDFLEAIGDRGRGEEIEQDLETLPGEAPDRALERRPGQHEKPAHRVGEIGGDDEASEPGGNVADRHPAPVPLADIAPGDVAAADDDIEVLVLDRGQHARQQPLVMLKIGVDDREVGGAAGEHPLDHRGGKPSPPDTLHAADTGIVSGERTNPVGGAVGQIVVDIDDLPRDPAQCCIEPREQHLDIVALVEGRDDDGEFDPLWRRSEIGRRPLGHRRGGLIR